MRLHEVIKSDLRVCELESSEFRVDNLNEIVDLFAHCPNARSPGVYTYLVDRYHVLAARYTPDNFWVFLKKENLELFGKMLYRVEYSPDTIPSLPLHNGKPEYGQVMNKVSLISRDWYYVIESDLSD